MKAGLTGFSYFVALFNRQYEKATLSNPPSFNILSGKSGPKHYERGGIFLRHHIRWCGSKQYEKVPKVL